MADIFADSSVDLISPLTHAAQVTPHDTNPLTQVSRQIYVGGFGDLAVEMKSGATLVFANVPAGSTLPYRVSRVLATGTTATDIVVLW